MAQKDVFDLLIEVCKENQIVMMDQTTTEGILATYAGLLNSVCSICGGANRMAIPDKENL